MIALKALIDSKKFQSTIVCLVVALGARLGFDVDKEIVLAIIGLFGLLIAAQGAADFGKEATRLRTEFDAADTGEWPTPPPLPSLPPPPPSVTALVMFLVAGGASIGLITSQMACAGGTGVATKRAFGNMVDCLKPDVQQVKAEVAPLAKDAIEHATNHDGSVNKDELRAAFRPLKSAALRCAAAAAITEAILAAAKPPAPDAPQSEGSRASSAELLEVWEEIRREEFGGDIFLLESGPW